MPGNETHRQGSSTQETGRSHCLWRLTETVLVAWVVCLMAAMTQLIVLDAIGGGLFAMFPEYVLNRLTTAAVITFAGAVYTLPLTIWIARIRQGNLIVVVFVYSFLGFAGPNVFAAILDLDLVAAVMWFTVGVLGIIPAGVFGWIIWRHLVRGRRDRRVDVGVPAAIAAVLVAVAIAIKYAPPRTDATDASPPIRVGAAELAGVVSEVVVGDHVFAVPATYLGYEPSHRAVYDRLTLSLPPPPGAAGRLRLSVGPPFREGALESIFRRNISRPGEVVYQFTGRYRDLSRYRHQDLSRRHAADDIYVWPSATDVRTHIMCSGRRSPEVSGEASPGCGHRFIEYGLSFRLEYPRESLPHWQSIEHDVRERFDEYHRGPATPQDDPD